MFTNERFWNISADAKMLYGILLDRMSLSAKNGWIDKNGRVYLRYPNAKFFIVDPENEYAPLVKAMGGEVVDISPVSETHFNPLDFKYNKDTGILPQNEKSEFVLSLFEKIMEPQNVMPGDKSLVDACLKNIYQPLTIPTTRLRVRHWWICGKNCKGSVSRAPSSLPLRCSFLQQAA